MEQRYEAIREGLKYSFHENNDLDLAKH